MDPTKHYDNRLFTLRRMPTASVACWSYFDTWPTATGLGLRRAPEVIDDGKIAAPGLI